MNEENKMPATVQFDATLDEMVDMVERSVELSGMGRRTLMSGFWAAFALSLFVGAVLPEPFGVRVAFGILTGIIGATINAVTFRRRIRKEIRIQNEKLYSAASSMIFQYSLNDAGISFRSAGTELAVEWQAIASHRITPAFLEIVTDKFLVAQIPIRAFSAPEALQAWANAIGAKTSAASKQSSEK